MIIEQLKIHNLRGIKEMNINHLSQINVFFGKNNCGKSSLLEGVFLLSGLSNPRLPININYWRDYLNLNEKDLDINFYNLDTDKLILIESYKNNEISRKLEISKFYSNSKTINVQDLAEQASNSIANDFYGYKLKFSVDHSKPYSSEIVITESKDENRNYNAKVNQDKRYTESVIAKMLTANMPFQSRISYFKKMITNKEEGSIVEALSQIDSRIQSIDLVGNDVMVDLGLKTLLPINVMGDGIRKLLSIIVSLYECKNGILIIDEIDNGLHFSAMKNLWKSIIPFSIQNNVQLFLSTHNIDLLNYLAEVIKEEDYNVYKDKILAHKLVHTDDGTLHTLSYNYDKFAYLLQQKTEIR